MTPQPGNSVTRPIQDRVPVPHLGLAVLLVAGAGIAAYHNTFSVPFLFDDYDAVVANPSIRHLGSWAIFQPPAGGTGVSGRPLVNASLALNFALGGLDVRGYHVLNLACHILAALTLLGVVRRTLTGLCPAWTAGRALAGALAVAVIWEVHPLQTESVTCIVQRNEVMMGLFYLLTLYLFIRYTEQDRLRWALLSVAACLAGMATKEVMVTAPFLVLLYDCTFVAGTPMEAWRRRRKYYLGLAATWLLLALLVLRQGGARGAAAGFGLGVSPSTYALTQCRAITHYLGLAFWPHPLVLDYGTPLVRGAGEVLPQALLLVLLAGATLCIPCGGNPPSVSPASFFSPSWPPALAF